MLPKRRESAYWLRRNTAYRIDPLLKKMVEVEPPVDPHRLQGNPRGNSETYFQGRYHRTVTISHAKGLKPRKSSHDVDYRRD